MDTKPRHKRVLHDSTPRGLPRWLRAADNAVRNPNSPGARLYYRRVANAQRLRERLGDSGPSVFYNWRNERDAITCGLFCTGMHAQQAHLSEFKIEQWGTKTYTAYDGERHESPNYLRVETPVTEDRLLDFLMQSEKVNLLAVSGVVLKRPVKCAVCGTPVKP